jgi:hypothetical protein
LVSHRPFICSAVATAAAEVAVKRQRQPLLQQSLLPTSLPLKLIDTNISSRTESNSSTAAAQLSVDQPAS